MRSRAGFALAILILLLPAALAGQEPQGPPKLNIVVAEGEGAINNIKQRTARDTIVQVEDENHKPVAGAAVVFLLPGDGPGGTFAGGAKTAALVTDNNGQAVMPRLQPNQLDGQFQIRVTASHQGYQPANGVIHQSVGSGGAGGAAPAAHAGISGKVIGIIIAVAAAGAVGAALGLRGGGSNNTTTTTTSMPSGTISLGTGGATLGPPH